MSSPTLNGVKWIQGDPECGAPMFLRQFTIASANVTKIAICGLGYFEMYINGVKATEDILNPVWSNYCERDVKSMLYPIKDKMTCRTYYRVYDISSFVHDGENTLGVWLGNGWFNQHERNVEGDMRYGTPRLAYSIVADDVLVAQSDENTLWRSSFIIRNNLYFGETQDLSLAHFDEWDFSLDWRYATLTSAPCETLELQQCESDRVLRRIYPKCLGHMGEAMLYDAGEVISGDVVLRSCGNADQTVTVSFAETRNTDGSLEYYSTAGTDGQMQRDEFICRGGELLQVHFVWHGFRYFEVTGAAEVVCCRVVGESFPVTSSFYSDNITLNWYYDAFVRTLYGCLHGGVSTDSSNRERLGYTGDGQLSCESALLLTKSDAFYRKWMQDIFDCQDMSTGHVQHTAPFYGGGGGPGCWGGAVVVVPYCVYMKTGDVSVLEAALPHIDKYMDYLENHSEDGLVVREEEGGWCLGDWCGWQGNKLPTEYVNTYYYMHFVDLLERINVVTPVLSLDRRKHYRVAAAESMTRHYFDSNTGDFAGGVQAANALAVDVGLGDARTLARLNERYSGGNLDTGIVGTDVLLRILFKHGYAQTAFGLLTAKGCPSFEHWRVNGATTLWENWEGKDCSHAHQMFGGAVRYLFRYLLGIRNDHASDRFIIAPMTVNGLNYVCGHVETNTGKIGVTVDKTQDIIRITVTIDGAIDARFIYGGSEHILNIGEQTFCF